MKSIFFIIIFCFASFASIGQDYVVLNVKGSVSTPGRGNLKPKDKLKASDKLVFATSKDAVAVVGAKTGRFVITPSPKAKDNELMVYVKDAITPGTKKLSTRSGLFNNALDFAQYFKDTVLLLPVMKYRTSYKQDEKNFFFIRYNYKGEEISKKLSASGDTLIIIRSELYSVDKKPIEAIEVSDMRLLYLEGSEIHSLAKMNVTSPNPDELTEGIKALKTVFPEKEIRDEAISYLTELYGKVDDSNFDAWLRSLR
jgi:hypothetical protein